MFPADFNHSSTDAHHTFKMKWVPSYLSQFVAAFMLSCWRLTRLCRRAVKALSSALDRILGRPTFGDQQSQGDQELLSFILKVFIQSICHFRKRKTIDIFCVTSFQLLADPAVCFNLHLKLELWEIDLFIRLAALPIRPNLLYHQKTSQCCHYKQTKLEILLRNLHIVTGQCTRSQQC